MIIYPNQRIITIKENATTENNYEIKFSAMRDLKPTSYIMWEYICSNQRGFDLLLSRVDVMNQTGISSSSYDNAIKELKEKGYLVHTSDNRYDFYATPAPAT